jgi:hypothetical protein
MRHGIREKCLNCEPWDYSKPTKPACDVNGVEMTEP